ncbi:hypothetical protein [uncultured Paraglaciecola sp.]|uniref:hypothetical protein n=1 Tax=uncultured Paraglaciecola sp. TaxID=1765024 RepID=UPI0030D8754F|tara:strand:+ start:4099 stop:4521 length:423 start_codon:yes stop_codon:yes gene_type:complete
MHENVNKPGRWPLIRQGIVFQFKLGLDALRDILMSPVSIVLIIVDVVMANNQQQSYFNRLMRLGKKSDHWINLFAVDSPKGKSDDIKESADSNVDYWITKIETVVKEQQVDGKLTQSGKAKLQQYFGKIMQNNNKQESKD